MLLQCAAETWNEIRAQFAEPSSRTLARDTRLKASSTGVWWGANVTTCCTMLYVAVGKAQQPLTAVPTAVVHWTHGQVASVVCSLVTASAKCLPFTLASPHLCPLKRVTEHNENGYMWWKKKSRWGRDFPPAQTGPAAQIAYCSMGIGLFRW